MVNDSPFEKGDMVQPKTPQRVRAVDYRGFSVSQGQPLIINGVHYEKGEWFLEFQGIPLGKRGYPKFPADKFELVPAPGSC